ncbi:MAG: GAF domain-containing protein, partial [Betaproteobacteria bacterium]|nr:GAF domain-containing protein [Betaproteobacteria bacterium]
MAAPTKAELQARVAKLERALAREKKRKGVKEDLAQARAAQAATAKILRVIRKSPSDVQPVFEAIADAAMRLLKAFSVTVVRFDGTQLQFGATRGARRGSEARVRALFPQPALNSDIAGRSILARNVVNVADARRDKSRAMREHARARGFRSVVAVPLLHESAPIGAIAATRSTAGLFSAAEVELLRSFADQAVIAVENARRFHQTKEALERQTATADILKVISGSPTDVQPVFDEVANSSMRLLGALSAAVALRKGDKLQLAAFTSTNPAGDAALKKFFPLSLVDDRETNLARAVISGAPIHVSDTEGTHGSPTLRAMGRKRGYRSFLVVPMLSKGAAIGTLSVTHREAEQFGDHDIELLKTFADQAVIAIENVRLFNETKEALERQTATADILKVISGSPTDVQPVFDAVARSSMRLLGALSASVSIRAGDMLQLGAFTSTSKTGDQAVRGLFPLSLTLNRDTILAQSVLKAAPAQVGDAQGSRRRPRLRQIARRRGFQSIIAVPMLSKGTAIGTVSVTRREAGGFSDHEVGLLTTFADQAVIAIENVRLFNETKEALARQTATSEILKVIASSPSDVRPVFDAIVESAAALFRRTASLRLVDDEFLRRVARSAPVRAEQALPERMTIDRESLVGQVALEGRAIQVPDLRHPSAPVYARKNAHKWAFRSSAVAPLLRGGRAIGVIAMTSPEPGALSEKQMELLSTFANQAVIAIENARLFNETKDALERQTATSEVLRVISSSPTDLQPVFEAILSRAIELCEGNAAILWRFDGGHLRVAAHKNTSAQGLAYLQAHPLVPGPYNPTPRAALERRIVHEVDVFSNADYRPLIPRGAAKGSHQSATQIAIPLLTERQVLGVISIWRFEKKPFAEKQIALLSTFADQAVIAIENVRLFNETREALERQTATSDVLRVISTSPTDVLPVLDAIAENAARLCESSDAQVLLLDDGGLRIAAQHGSEIRLTVGTSLPLNRDSATARAVIDAAVVHVADVAALPAGELEKTKKNAADSGWQSILSVPLLRDGIAIGAIAVRRPKARAFTQRQIALVETFADQAVIAIENVRLFNETKEALERQTATSEILKVISSSPTDVQPVFDTIVKNAVELSDALFSAVYRYDGDQLHLVAHHNYTPEVLELENRVYPMRPDRGQAVGRAILDRRLVHITDALTDADYQHDIATTGGWRSMVAVPMFREGTPVGVIWVARAQIGPFSNHQIALLQTFADQAVIAIENVRLFNETREALERQTATAEVLSAISASPTDTQPVFDIIAERAVTLCGAQDSAVMRYDGKLVHLAADYNLAPDAGEALRRAFPCTLEHNSAAVRTIRTEQVVQIHDVTELPDYQLADVAKAGSVRRILGVPLMRGGEAIGAVVVAHGEPGRFSDHQIGLIKTFANQAVIAIENVRLFNETKEALERQTASAEVLQVISGSLADTQPVFEVILESCERLFKGRHVGITLVGEDGLAHIGAYHGPAAQTFREMYPLPINRETGTGLAIIERRTLHYPDAEGGAEVPESVRRGARITGLKSVVMTPLLGKDRTIGAMFVGREFAGAFSDNEIALIKTFADQAVIAIENV